MITVVNNKLYKWFPYKCKHFIKCWEFVRYLRYCVKIKRFVRFRLNVKSHRKNVLINSFNLLEKTKTNGKLGRHWLQWPSVTVITANDAFFFFDSIVNSDGDARPSGMFADTGARRLHGRNGYRASTSYVTVVPPSPVQMCNTAQKS